MIVLAIAALVSSLYVFALGLINTAIDPNKTPTFMKVAETKRTIAVGMREMTETEKRRRFLWFALAAFPNVLFVIVYLLVG